MTTTPAATSEMDHLDQLGAKAFAGFLVRKDLVRKYSRQYPVPTYVVEFLLGRSCASRESGSWQRRTDAEAKAGQLHWRCPGASPGPLATVNLPAPGTGATDARAHRTGQSRIPYRSPAAPAPWWMGCRWADARAKPNAVMARPWCGHSMPRAGPPAGRWLVSMCCAAPINSGKPIGRACQRLRAAVKRHKGEER